MELTGQEEVWPCSKVVEKLTREKMDKQLQCRAHCAAQCSLVLKAPTQSMSNKRCRHPVLG